MRSAASGLVRAGVPTWLAQRVDELARGDSAELSTYLQTVGEAVLIEETQTRCRCHFLTRDGNDRPRVAALAERLARDAMDYCIPRTRIREARDYLDATGKTEKFSRLDAEARALFTALENSGEGGELLLYLLLESVLGLPQLLCKMPLKTNSNMHVHGADGIHGRVLDDGVLALYWGESKLYATASSAARACLEGLADFLNDAGGGVATRDLALLREELELDDPELTEALRLYFTENTAETTMVRYCGAGLVGFSLDEYPTPFDEDGRSITEEVAKLIADWHGHAKGRVDHHKLSAFDIELFFVPFPDVGAFRAELKKALRR